MTETHTGVQGDEILDASTRQTPAEVNDREKRAAASTDYTADDVSYDDIAALAYDLWARRGGGHGSDFEDWLEAERQLRDARRRR
jgi:hypothetical protein